jgi:serine O-acetyltransferase
MSQAWLGQRLMRAFYRAQRWQRVPLLSQWFACSKQFWCLICGAEVSLTSKIGPGLTLYHPNGVVIHPLAVIGSNCVLCQQVTLGLGSRPGAPTLGDRVFVGAGAKIIGAVTVGSDAEIGANAVVVRDVPPGAIVVGVPAQVWRVKPLGELARGAA